MDYEESIGAINHMNLNNMLTIVIATYNRYKYLLRLLKYYDSYGFPAKILILDSSSDNPEKTDFVSFLCNKQIEHRRFPSDIRVEEKIMQGIQYISTPYVVFCADDDFITPTGLEKSIDFLESNLDCVAAHGRYIAFNRPEDNPDATEWKVKADGDRSIESDDCGKRLLSHLSNYKTPTFYGVHRTDILKLIWIASKEYTDDYRFGELLQTALIAIYGKIKVLDVLYSARQHNSYSTGQTSKNLTDFIVEGSFNMKYERFKKCLANKLCGCTDMNYAMSEKLVDIATNNYLKRRYGFSMNALRFRSMVRKSLIGKFINSTGLLSTFCKFKKKSEQVSSKPIFRSNIPYNDPTHPYYPAFSRIRNAINSGD